MTEYFLRQRCTGILLACCVVGLSTSTGCTKSAPNGTVSGKVLLEGKPLPTGCTIAFTSERATASGIVDANGVYKLLNGGKAGVPAATYQVAVSPPSQQMSDADYEKLMSPGGAATPAAPTVVIPAKFLNPTTSGLSYTVKEGKNTIDIDLK